MAFWRKGKEKKELQRLVADKMRDEKLNSIILNNYESDENKKQVSVPYDVDYGNASQSFKGEKKHKDEAKEHGLMVQLIENTELSSRKFVLNPENVIRIGSGLENNDIVVASGDISYIQCEIFKAGEKIYVRNKGNQVRTVIKRKRQKAIVDNRGIGLMSGDRIILGNITYDITIIEV